MTWRMCAGATQMISEHSESMIEAAARSRRSGIWLRIAERLVIWDGVGMGLGFPGLKMLFDGCAIENVGAEFSQTLARAERIIVRHDA